MKVFGLAGWSGSGKTTLLCRLLPLFRERGLRVSTLKHAHHAFDLDQPGKDSHQHRLAGAEEVLITSSKRWALMHELRDQPEPSLEELIGRMTPVDLLLIEGFKQEGHAKLEVHRPALGKPLLAPGNPTVVAVASDAPGNASLQNLAVPCLPLEDVEAIGDFILDHCGLA